jgi:hypothetical protein
MAARQIQVFQHPPYLPDLAPADIFLFFKYKRELAGLTLTQKAKIEDYNKTFWQLYEYCEKVCQD